MPGRKIGSAGKHRRISGRGSPMETKYSGESVYSREMLLWCAVVAVCVVSVKGACTPEMPTHYKFDGCGNNIHNPSWG